MFLGSVMMLVSCGDDAPAVTQAFAPLHYEYLPKLRLNVGDVQVENRSLPVSAQDVASSSPVVPAAALQQMARDRLFAAGSSGHADFVIDQASIVRSPGGALDGHLAVHLDVAGPGRNREGFAEAQVAREFTPGTQPVDPTAQLYDLTRQMMTDMNVELEFQVKRSLQAFLVTPGSAPAAVAAQPLDVPGTPPPVPAPPVLPPATPGTDETGYQDPAALPPVQRSPAPGFLVPPQ